jgi:hypothetical protein
VHGALAERREDREPDIAAPDGASSAASRLEELADAGSGPETGAEVALAVAAVMVAVVIAAP